MLGKNAFSKNFNITPSTWYIERENVDLLMNNFGHVSQNSFFSSPMKFLRENSTDRKIVVFIDFRHRAKNFFSRQKNSSGLSKLCSTSLGEHFGERVFENIFYDLQTLSQSVSVSAVKIFSKLVKTAFQVFRRKLSLKFFLPKKLPFFIIVVNSGEFFGFPVEKFYL